MKYTNVHPFAGKGNISVVDFSARRAYNRCWFWKFVVANRYYSTRDFYVNSVRVHRIIIVVPAPFVYYYWCSDSIWPVAKKRKQITRSYERSNGYLYILSLIIALHVHLDVPIYIYYTHTIVVYTYLWHIRTPTLSMSRKYKKSQTRIIFFIVLILFETVDWPQRSSSSSSLSNEPITDSCREYNFIRYAAQSWFRCMN